MLVDANARGSGKGLLVDTIAIITTGRPISRSPQPRDDDELRKHITSIARAGTPAALIDNITGKFTYRSFDAALTCEGRWADRILGQTARREWPLPTVWFLTSNNAALSSDTARRVLPIRLLSDAEHPEDRRDFAHSDLKSWIVGERPRLVCAALTILRAYHEAERPQTEMVPWGSFVEWGRMIRQCLVWLGLPDPVHARHELRERADVDRGAIATVLCEIEQCTPDGTVISAAELLKHSAGRAELRAAIDELSPPRAGVDLTAQRLGSLLRSLRDRVVDGLRLEGHIGHGGALRWRVREVHSSPEGVDRHHRHQRHQAAPLPGDDGDIGEDETPRGEADNCEKQPNGADADVDANQPAPPPAHPRRERAELVGGTLQVRSRPGEGTRLIVEVQGG